MRFQKAGNLLEPRPQKLTNNQENFQCAAQQARPSPLSLEVNRNKLTCGGVTVENDFGSFASFTFDL